MDPKSSLSKRTIKQATVDVFSRNEFGDTPLYLAAEKGDVEVVKMLLSNGADVNASNDLKKTPLYIAAKYGHIAVVELLLAKGADVNAKRTGEISPLYSAIR